VVIHIAAIEKALDELVRVLAPGGTLALYVSNSQFLFNRPGRGCERLPMGHARKFELHGERIWVWFIDIGAVVRYLTQHGLSLEKRHAGKFAGVRQRLSPRSRQLVWQFNNCWFQFSLPPQLAYMNLLVFRKREA
jgi:hypothetical protein